MKYYPKHNKMINIYKSQSEAGRALGTSAGNISRAIKQHSLCCGFYWVEFNES